jgi:hypothetical protein
MRLSERLRVERRLAAAETIVAERQLSQLMHMLADETNAASPDVGTEIAGCLARAVGAAKSGAVETKAQFVRRVLADLAVAVPSVAERVATALGIDLPKPYAIPTP